MRRRGWSVLPLAPRVARWSLEPPTLPVADPFDELERLPADESRSRARSKRPGVETEEERDQDGVQEEDEPQVPLFPDEEEERQNDDRDLEDDGHGRLTPPGAPARSS